MLVAGTRLSTPADPELDAFLQAYHEDSESVAYQVPWNTFGLWNLRYFQKYVHRFDEITEWDGKSTVETVRGEGRLQGMEDGLAVARAAHYFGLKFALLPDTVQWDVNPKKHESHLDKLARKTTVLLEFMRIRGYSLESLQAANASPEA